MLEGTLSVENTKLPAHKFRILFNGGFRESVQKRNHIKFSTKSNQNYIEIFFH